MPFSVYWYFHRWWNIMACKITSILAWIKEVPPNCTSSHGIFFTTTHLQGGKNPVFLNNSSMKQWQLFILIIDFLMHVFLILSMNLYAEMQLHTKYYWNMMVFSKQKAPLLLSELQKKWAAFFMEFHFYLEQRLTQTMVFQIGIDVSWKMNEVRLSFRWKKWQYLLPGILTEFLNI